MNINNYAESSIVDFNISNIVAMKQCWVSNGYFSYLKFPRHDNGITYVLCEKIIYNLPDKSVITAKRNDIVFIPKGTCYKVNFINTGESKNADYLINFTLSDVLGASLLTSDKITVVSPDDYHTYKTDFSNIVMLYKNTANRIIEIKAKTLMLLDNLIKQSKITPQEFDIKRCVEYINENFSKKTDVSALARLCGVSGTTFRKQFKGSTGLSPVRYINQLKINKACSMLESSEISIEEISELLDFYDLSYFYKIFKSLKGVTPLEYKNKNTDCL